MPEHIPHEARVHLGNADLDWSGYREVRFWHPWEGFTLLSRVDGLVWWVAPPRMREHAW